MKQYSKNKTDREMFIKIIKDSTNDIGMDLEIDEYVLSQDVLLN